MDRHQAQDGPSNVFGSLQDFFDPDQHPPAPLVLLPASLNPFPIEEKVKLYAKLSYLSPTLNLKWAPAYEMIRQAAGSGSFRDTHSLVEASSGNMALSLAMLSRAFGLAKVAAFVPADLAFVKKELLHLAGVDLIFCTDGPNESSAIEKARKQGTEAGFLNLAQYENPGNPAAHARWTATSIWNQTRGALTVFCSGLGTTGTLVGAREAFQALSPQVLAVGCMCAPGSAVPGVRSEERLAQIRFDWRKGIHHIEVETKESYRASLRLIRIGLMAGPSSGFALAGLLRFLEASRKDPAAWESLRNEAGEIVAAFVCGDTPHLYIDKYSTILDAADFAL